MKITEFNKYIEISELSYFSVEKIFDCGQCFRFDPDPTGGISGVAMGSFYRFTQENESTVRIYNTSKNDFDQKLFRYLSLDRDYGIMNEDIISRFGSDETIKKAVEAGKGIRILRQEAFEVLISFIISQNNNIPRIKGLVEALCRRCGRNIGEEKYAFPEPEAIVKLGIDGLRELKVGFRAPYIYDAALRVTEGATDLEIIASLDTLSAGEQLMKIKGVGPKVASCILLFGLDKTDTFPVDVWIKRVLDKYYPEGIDISTLGNYRGLAQQYLFYYERYNNNA
ncbi:MAG: DNA-3-methyladenine glycosylase 2 family protein [Ruminococcaceae bacterium]|nr:DNA-3-methyladenine glycosylase 2 family protein [Oscillospiraceae bacterium]